MIAALQTKRLCYFFQPHRRLHTQLLCHFFKQTTKLRHQRSAKKIRRLRGKGATSAKCPEEGLQTQRLFHFDFVQTNHAAPPEVSKQNPQTPRQRCHFCQAPQGGAANSPTVSLG